jgi:hypothetical protein
MAYDPECELLAVYFLACSLITSAKGFHPPGGVPRGPAQVLAQHIQDAVEDWLRGYEADLARDEAKEAP